MAKKGSRVQVILECTEHKNQRETRYQPVYYRKE